MHNMLVRVYWGFHDGGKTEYPKDPDLAVAQAFAYKYAKPIGKGIGGTVMNLPGVLKQGLTKGLAQQPSTDNAKRRQQNIRCASFG